MPSRKQMQQERLGLGLARDAGNGRSDLGALQERMVNGDGPSLAPGISDRQRKIEREAELAAREDSEPEGPSRAWKGWLIAAGIQLAILLLAVLVFGGCAHEPAAPTAPKPPAIVVLSERVGSAAADIIETATGQRPFAASVPGLPVIVFSPKDADDPGLIAHELCHHRQQVDLGDARWAALYVRDLADCERMAVDRGTCLKTIPLEAECYQVQRAIAAGGAP